MITAHIHRLVRNLTNRSYVSAGTYWAIRRLTGVQFHFVYATYLNSSTSTQVALPLEFFVLESEADLKKLPKNIEIQLNEQSGFSCRDLFEQNARIYLLMDGEKLACQLNIRQSEVVVDSPVDLILRFESGTVFLNYLYTRDAYRGHGLAGKLISLACEDLARKGLHRCLAHIRATNHASLSSFRKAGWTTCGRIISTTSGRLIAAPGCEQSGMQITQFKRV